MTNKTETMPDVIWAAMLANGSTCWFRQIFGSLNDKFGYVKNMSQTKYLRADTVSAAVREAVAVLDDMIQKDSIGDYLTTPHELACKKALAALRGLGE